VTLFLIAQAVRVLAGEPGFDHIQDVAAVATFLADAEKSDVEFDNVEIVNRDDPQANTAEAFLAYARDCSIKEISAVASADRRLPIGVTWDCGRLIEVDGGRRFEERTAGFWVREGEVSKITFGNPITIRIPPAQEVTD
jgi:hypothetical protein